MKISACYIVKNEAAVLARSLQSIQGQVDEIIVVDTGSVDATKEIAQQFGAKIFDFVWIDDFAAARNFSLSKATGDYVLAIDADQYFSTETCGSLRQALESRQRAEAVAVTSVNIDSVTQEYQGEAFELRAFQHRADIKYIGKIHEQLCREDNKQLQLAFVPPEELLIFHTGYSADVSREKAERNLRLLLKEYEIGENKERLYMYLADAYFGLDNSVEAKKWALLDVNSGRKPVNFASRSYRMLLRYLAQEGYNSEQRLKLTERAVKDFPEVPEFWAEYAEALAGRLCYGEAIAAGETALAKAKEPHRLEPWQFDADNAKLLEERIGQWQAVIKEMKKVRISACLIAKDDVQDIGRWADNVKVFADEIIYVDTGTSDNSPQIMAEKGIKAIPFGWNNDFAEARNFAIAQATGEWIVFTDADELFVQPEQIRPYLAERMLKNDAEAVQVTIVNIDADDDNREIQRFPAIRLFRRQADICYYGAIHETLQKKSGPLQIISESERLLIKHTGYSSSRITQKLERNLALLEAEIAKTGVQPRHHRYLAECNLGLKRYDKALTESLAALTTQGAATTGSDSDMYFTALQAMKELKKPVAERQLLLETAAAAFPDLPDFWAELGLLLLATEKDKAIKFLQRAISLYENPVKQAAATRFSNLGDRVYLAVAEEAFRRGDKLSAEDLCYKALQFNCFYEAALDLWFRLFTDEKTAFARIAEFYQLPKQQEFLLYFFQKREMWALSEAIGGGQLAAETGFQDELAEFYQLRQAEEYESLYQKIVQKLTVDIQKLFALLVKLAVSGEKIDFVEQSSRQLPEGLQRLLVKLQGNQIELTNDGFSTFQTFLPALCRYLAEAELVQSLQIVNGADKSQIIVLAGKLTDMEQWTAAFSLYQQLPADSELINSDFWCQVGKCLYYLREFSAAQEAFARAESLGTERAEVAVYLAWLEEEKINE